MKTLTIGNIDLSFHAASAAVVHMIARNHGLDIQVLSAPHEKAFQLLAEDKVDLLVSAWLPASHSKYLDPLSDRTTKITTLYEPYCIWAVPDYLPENDVSSIADLLKPEVIANFDLRIQGINPGAGISRFSAAMIQKYKLGDAGYSFHTGSESDCFGRVIRGFANKENFVVPLWHPQYLHHSYKLRPLEEPLGLLGGKDEATLIARNKILTELPTAFLDELRKLHIGNAAVSMIDHKITVENESPHEVAQAWLDSHKTN